MSFLNKILLSLLCVIVFTYSAFSMDRDIEEGKQSHLVEMTSQFPAVNGSSPLVTRTLRPSNSDVIEEKSDHGDGDTKTDEENSNDSIDSILLGNQDSTYSNWLLECYAKKSSTCWDFFYSWLGDLDSVSHAAETALTACTQFIKSEHIAAYAIEAAMIADTLHKLYTLSQKIGPIRAKQARMYEAQNKANALRDQDPNYPLLINGKDVAENTDFYASESTACCYNFCATYRNIAWDQVGVLAILCRVFANSIITFSLASDPHKCKTLLFAATLLRIGGTFCYLYAKSLSKNTKEIEQKAMDSATFIKHRKRVKKNAIIDSANGGDAANMV